MGYERAYSLRFLEASATVSIMYINRAVNTDAFLSVCSRLQRMSVCDAGSSKGCLRAVRGAYIYVQVNNITREYLNGDVCMMAKGSWSV